MKIYNNLVKFLFEISYKVLLLYIIAFCEEKVTGFIDGKKIKLIQLDTIIPAKSFEL